MTFGNVIYWVGVVFLVLGTVLTYWGTQLKSKEDTQELKTAISERNDEVKNLSSYITQLKTEQEKQLLLQEAPIVQILPKGNVKGSPGRFELSIRNSGLSDLEDIDIYEDYFVALASKNTPIQLNRFGTFSTDPNTRVKSLNSHSAEKFIIEFKSTLQRMTQFYLDDKNKGQRMMVGRIKINFMRKIDGKKFTYSKVFIIAGGGEVLIDYDSSRDLPTEFDAYTYNDVKQALGVAE